MTQRWKQELVKTFKFELERLTDTERGVAKRLGVDIREFVVAKIRRGMNTCRGDSSVMSIDEVCAAPTRKDASIGCDQSRVHWE